MNMERMNWKDGWNKAGNFSYYIENGIFVRGLSHEGRPVKPFVKSKAGGYDRVYNMKANKRNYEKIYWF